MDRDDLATAQGQRNQFAYSIVRIAVALGVVDGKQPYTGEQVAFLAETVEDALLRVAEHHAPEFAAERKALLASMPQLRSL